MADTDTPFPRSRPTPPHGTDCVQEPRIEDLSRRVRDLERHKGATDQRFGDGAVTMTELRGAIDLLRTETQASVSALRGSVEALTKALTEAKAPNPVLGKILDAVITWAVPAAIVAIIWLAVQSGVVPVRAPAVTTPATQGAAP